MEQNEKGALAMRITCPLCGERDRREFYYKGAALERPAAEADLDAWHAHVHLRENPAGELEELWYHEMGCNSWLRVTRDTATHEITDVVLAADAGLGGAR
ncbi:sarcosine oxidase, delta subunit family protein [Roseobacter sp. SK209-2-6]|nr:sarcosine oxidase, delta subunit family protein [Roseobacter sp. SK209-2-6]